MRPIGFSTGSFHKTIHPVSKMAIDQCWNAGSDAIEISCLEYEYLDELLELDEKDFSGFKHVSLHAPTKGIIYGYNQRGCYARDMIYAAHCRINFDNIVIHPNRLKDFGLFSGLGLPISFENTDSKHPAFGRPLDLFAFAGKATSAYRITLDLAHVKDFDATMDMVKDFEQAFQSHICQLHISGFNGHHVPLYSDLHNPIIDACPGGNTPVIIESVCANLEEARLEIEYIKSRLHLRK